MRVSHGARGPPLVERTEVRKRRQHRLLRGIRCRIETAEDAKRRRASLGPPPPRQLLARIGIAEAGRVDQAVLGIRRRGSTKSHCHLIDIRRREPLCCVQAGLDLP